jgi:putative transposase
VKGVCRDWNISIRRACRVLELDSSTYHYQSRRIEQASLEARIKEICETRVRYGYRRVHVMLRREGLELNLKKTYRVYSELGLQLRNKTPKRRVKQSFERTTRKRAVQMKLGLWTLFTISWQRAGRSGF